MLSCKIAPFAVANRYATCILTKFWLSGLTPEPVRQGLGRIAERYQLVWIKQLIPDTTEAENSVKEEKVSSLAQKRPWRDETNEPDPGPSRIKLRQDGRTGV